MTPEQLESRRLQIEAYCREEEEVRLEAERRKRLVEIEIEIIKHAVDYRNDITRVFYDE